MEAEMRQIKKMIEEYGVQEAKRSKLGDLVRDMDHSMGVDKENSSVEGNEGEDTLKEYVLREKAELKDLQAKLEQEKRQFKADKRDTESLKYSEPEVYRQRMTVLDKVQKSIEERIDSVNERIAKVKQAERKLR